MSRWILAAASAAVGVATYLSLQPPIKHYDPLLAQCMVPDLHSLDPASLPPFHRTNILLIDQFMCLITTFFHDAIMSPAGSLVVRIFTPLGGAAVLIAALESTRPTVRWFAWMYPLIIVLGQLVGIGVVIPLLWVPSMVLGAPHKGSAHGPLRSSLVWVIAIASISSLVVMAVMTEMADDMAFFAPACLVINFAPVVAPLLWIPIHAMLYAAEGPVASIPTAHASGTRSASAIYKTVAIVSSLYWFYSLYMYFGVRSFDDAVRVFRDLVYVHAGRDNGAYFLLVDLVGCVTGFVLWALAEDGIRGVATVLALGALLGPGTGVFVFAVQREARLTRTAAVHGKKKTKTE
ncbi:hypothetical protein BC831DRAFT_514414 [Entophlyctis helioformis]|nr:hypothetical protein BC831DRAFT_514414 [Entophlyctis helioformis]